MRGQEPNALPGCARTALDHHTLTNIATLPGSRNSQKMLDLMMLVWGGFIGPCEPGETGPPDPIAPTDAGPCRCRAPGSAPDRPHGCSTGGPRGSSGSSFCVHRAHRAGIRDKQWVRDGCVHRMALFSREFFQEFPSFTEPCERECYSSTAHAGRDGEEVGHLSPQ